MTRVLLLSGELSLRGTTLYTVSLARDLKHRGHKVAVLGPGGLFEDLLREDRIEVLHAPVRSRMWRDFLYLRAYADGVRQFDADLIHVQHHALSAVGALVSRMTGVPWLLTVHEKVQRPLWFPFGVQPWVLAVSEDVRQSLVTVGGVPRERIEVTPNGVSPSLSALEDEGSPGEDKTPVVGTVNRIAPGRGIDLLLRAARRVLDQGRKACFLIIGEGPAEASARRLARDLELEEHVTFVLARAHTTDLFRPMDVFVSASDSEGHGIFLLTAMAEARPVISTAVGGVLSFLHDGENGLVVPRGDVEALAASILRLLDDPGLARRLGAEGFHDVRERFPLVTMIERTQAWYERALAG